MRTLLQDVHYGLHVLLKRPGFTLVAVTTLALGIGANTAIFSVVNGILLRPLPYRDPERIVTLWQRNDKIGVQRDDVAPANFLDWKERNHVFGQLSAAEPFGFDYTGDGEPENLRAWLVFSDFFETLGVGALHGRTFRPEEFQKGNDQVVVIGHGLWQRRFGSDPRIVGRNLMLDGKPFEIVGVLPAEVKFPEAKDLWVPRYVYEGGDEQDDRQDRLGARLVVIGRLKD
ncbi:MAG: ABC transporter permease, partial [Rubrivivax sp.]|nr:ABC transporter permease [Pyrinomonadaceae bacterium]